MLVFKLAKGVSLPPPRVSTAAVASLACSSTLLREDAAFGQVFVMLAQRSCADYASVHEGKHDVELFFIARNRRIQSVLIHFKPSLEIAALATW